MFVWLGNGFRLYKSSSSVFAACRSCSNLLLVPRLLIKYITDQPSKPRAITPKTTRNKFRLIQSMSEFYRSPEFHVDVEAKGQPVARFRHIACQRDRVRVEVLHL